MSQFQLRDGSSISVVDFDEFLLLRNIPKSNVSLPALGSAIYRLKLSGVEEVIATEVEVLLKISAGFEKAFLAEVDFSTNKREQSLQPIDLPIMFSNQDENWDLISAYTGLDRAAYIQKLLDCDFRVAMPGFLPGFIYLSGLPDELHVPRKATPAKRTDAGAFAIGGKYGGIYSLSSPAGWNVVGHTSKRLFRLNRIPPLDVSVGDRIALRSVDELAVEPNGADQEYVETDRTNGQLTILKPGLFTLLQDIGRPRLAFYAIPQSGCLDASAFQIANAILGNLHSAAAIECHFVAPTLRFDTSATICLSGADMGWQLNGKKIRTNRSLRVESGSVLSGSATRSGCRSYIGISGDIKSERTFGSMSCYPLGSFGGNQGRAFRAGDTIRWQAPNLEPPTIKYRKWEPESNLPLKFTPGPEYDLLDDESKSQLFKASFSISTESDRMGARLVGPELSTNRAMQDSVPLLPGMIQLTPSGQCIVVLQDGQTTGGYPRVGYLNATELQKLSQIQPRTPFEFIPA